MSMRVPVDGDGEVGEAADAGFAEAFDGAGGEAVCGDFDLSSQHALAAGETTVAVEHAPNLEASEVLIPFVVAPPTFGLLDVAGDGAGGDEGNRGVQPPEPR